jgi:hypothetical protein
VVGVYEVLFSTLSGDATLQGLLGGTSEDRKIYPITDTSRVALPAIRMAVLAGESQMAFSVNKPEVEITIASSIGASQLGSVAHRVDTLVNRARLGGNGIIIHLAKKIKESDEFDQETQEYRRCIRYVIIVTQE